MLVRDHARLLRGRLISRPLDYPRGTVPVHYLIRRLEDKITSRVVRLLIRTFLNPTRSFANLLRDQKPWYRDNRD
jgi:hypothetical protein